MTYNYDIWGMDGKDIDKEVQKLKDSGEWINILNGIGEKRVFSIEHLKVSDFPSNFKLIRTGRGGLDLIRNKLKPKWKEEVQWDREFDPIHATENINPVLQTGWRLSSYTFFIEKEDGMLLKLIPKNPYDKNI